MKWKAEPNIQEKCIGAFLDLAILWRLMNKPMSGYALSKLLVGEFGTIVSVGRVYNTLYSMQINGLIKGGRNKRGRVFSLTERGRKIAENNPDTAQEIQVFVKTLLCSQKYSLITQLA